MVMSTAAATLLGSGILGGASIGGGLLGASSSRAAARDSASAARDIAKLQMNWAKEIAHNAHTYEVQDLQQAGLNPILSTSGSGAQGLSINPPMPDTSGIAQAGQQINTGISNALSAIATAAEYTHKGAQTTNIIQDTENKQEQNALLKLEQTLTKVKTGLIDKQTAEQEIKNQMLNFDKEHQKIKFWFEQAERVAKALGIFIGGGGLAARSLFRLLDQKDNKLGYKYYNNYSEFQDNISMPSWRN